MKRKFKIAKFVPLAVLPLMLLTSCNLEVIPDGPVLMTAINYNEKERIIYSLDTPYETPNKKKKIIKGDYKPFWQHVQNKFNITLLEHQAAANSGDKKSVSYFRDNWLNKPYADISMGTVDAISKYSVAGNKETILDLKPYLDQTKFIVDATTGATKVDPDNKGVLPNLALFLKVNPGLKTSIMTAKHSHSNQGALYFVPYLDGFDDTERMMMVRQDYITKLLDGKDAKGKAFTTPLDTDTTILGSSRDAQYHPNYTRFIKDDKYTISLPDVDDDGKIKDPDNPSYEYEKKSVTNIIDQQNATINENKASSKELVTQFKKYIDDRYGQPGQDGSLFKNYSDLFLGWKACFDTDELIALMRIMKVSTRSLYGSGDNREMVTWFPTEWTNMRSADLYRWGGQVFGVRGPESRTGYLYLNGQNDYGQKYGKADKIHDCRGDKEMVELLENLQKLYNEGLLMQDFDSQQATGTTNRYFNEQLILEYTDPEEQVANKKYHGFMEYCFVNAESKLNEYTDEGPKKGLKTEDGCLYGPMIGAVTKWDTDNIIGEQEAEKRDTYMQFTESWISAKTSALCLNANLAKTPQKLANAFTLIDYIFSPDGKIAYNFGPVEDGYYYPGHVDDDTGNFIPDTPSTEELPTQVTYKGKIYPKFTPEAIAQQKEISGVARERVGTTLPFGYEKLNGMTYQSIREASQPGVDRVNRAIECNTFKHTCIKDPAVEYKKELGQVFTDHPEKKAFYKIVPATFLLTDGQNTDIARILDKSKLGSIYTDNTNTQFNIWDDYVMGKKASSAPEFKKYYETVNGPWECPKLVTYYQDAYELAV